MTTCIVKPTKPEIIGQRLKTIREKRHLSLQQVSAATGISVTALSYYENGKRFINSVSLFRLTEFYNISRNSVIGQ